MRRTSSEEPDGFVAGRAICVFDPEAISFAISPTGSPPASFPEKFRPGVTGRGGRGGARGARGAEAGRPTDLGDGGWMSWPPSPPPRSPCLAAPRTSWSWSLQPLKLRDPPKILIFEISNFE